MADVKYTESFNDFIKKILDNANIYYDKVDIDQAVLYEYIIITVNNADRYLIKIQRSIPVCTDLNGNICVEDVEYRLYKILENRNVPSIFITKERLELKL